MLAAVREIGPNVTAIVLAGVAGTAITADLGARKIREELDALQVLGVDPVKNLVVPRFLALMLVTGLFDIYAVLFGIFGGIIAELVNGQPLGPVLGHPVRQRLDHRPVGLGAEDDDLRRDHRDRLLLQGHDRLRRRRGRRRAVNQAVVIAFLAIFSFDYVFTQTLLATHPQILVIK